MHFSRATELIKKWRLLGIKRGKLLDMQGRELKVGDYVVTLHWHRRAFPLMVGRVKEINGEKYKTISIYEGANGLVYNIDETSNALHSTFVIIDLPDGRIKDFISAIEAGEIKGRYWQQKHPGNIQDLIIEMEKEDAYIPT